MPSGNKTVLEDASNHDSSLSVLDFACVAPLIQGNQTNGALSLAKQRVFQIDAVAIETLPCVTNNDCQCVFPIRMLLCLDTSYGRDSKGRPRLAHCLE